MSDSNYNLGPDTFIIRREPRTTKKRSISLDIKSGRLNEYDPDYHDALAAAFSRRGMTPREIADKLGVSVHRMTQWYELSESFRYAVDQGEDYTVAAVENAMLRRALGYSVNEEETKEGWNEKSGNYEERKTKRRHVPADTGAGKFWLQNKRPDLWKERTEVEQDLTVHWEEVRTEIIDGKTGELIDNVAEKVLNPHVPEENICEDEFVD